MKTIIEVEVSTNHEITRYWNRIDVENTLVKCISKRFQRAYNSPFLKENFLFQVGIFAELDKADKILTGTSSISLATYSDFYIYPFKYIDQRLLTSYKK